MSMLIEDVKRVAEICVLAKLKQSESLTEYSFLGATYPENQSRQTPVVATLMLSSVVEIKKNDNDILRVMVKGMNGAEWADGERVQLELPIFGNYVAGVYATYAEADYHLKYVDFHSMVSHG